MNSTEAPINYDTPYGEDTCSGCRRAQQAIARALEDAHVRRTEKVTRIELECDGAHRGTATLQATAVMLRTTRYQGKTTVKSRTHSTESESVKCPEGTRIAAQEDEDIRIDELTREHRRREEGFKRQWENYTQEEKIRREVESDVIWFLLGVTDRAERKAQDED